MNWEDLNEDSYNDYNDYINYDEYVNVNLNLNNNLNSDNRGEDIDLWNDLFEANNTPEAMIEKASLHEFTSLTMDKIKFKKVSLPKSIKKLNKLKSLEISNSNLEEIRKFPPNLEHLKVTNCMVSLFEANNAPISLTTLSFENNILELFLDGTFLLNLTEINLSSNFTRIHRKSDIKFK